MIMKKRPRDLKIGQGYTHLQCQPSPYTGPYYHTKFQLPNSNSFGVITSTMIFETLEDKSRSLMYNLNLVLILAHNHTKFQLQSQILLELASAQ